MVLRTYFWSRPHVAEGGQVRFSVALTNEMSMPLPMDFDLEIVLLAGGRDLKLELEDLKIIKHEAFGGVEAEVEGRLPEGLNDNIQLLVTSAQRYGIRSTKRRRGAMPGAMAYLDDVERLGGDLGDMAMGSSLCCLSSLVQSTEDSEHSFRCFDFKGQLLELREELSSEEMPTGGRLWDAGLVLAHWLADEKNSYRPEKNSTVLELGSGCGLPGIIAAKATNAHVYFSDKKAVLPLIALNVAKNCPGSKTSILELDWALEEDRQRALQRCGGFFEVVLMSDLCYSVGALPKLKQTILQLTCPKSKLLLAHKVREEGSEASNENPMKALEPWFDLLLRRSVGPPESEVLLFVMERQR